MKSALDTIKARLDDTTGRLSEHSKQLAETRGSQREHDVQDDERHKYVTEKLDALTAAVWGGTGLPARLGWVEKVVEQLNASLAAEVTLRKTDQAEARNRRFVMICLVAGALLTDIVSPLIVYLILKK